MIPVVLIFAGHSIMTLVVIKKRSRGSIMLVFAVLLCLGCFMGPGMSPFHHDGTAQRRMNACCANMRYLEGAVDMWEMNQEEIAVMPSGIISTYTEDGPIGKLLRADGEVKRIPRCKSGGIYHFDYETYTIRCDVHGTTDTLRMEGENGP